MKLRSTKFAILCVLSLSSLVVDSKPIYSTEVWQQLPNDQLSLPLMRLNSTPLVQANQPILQKQGTLETGDAFLPSDSSLYDQYTFEGEIGQTVTVRLESTAFDTNLILLNTEGIIGKNDDIGFGNTNSILTITLPRDGTYQILANAHGVQGRGSYVLSLTPATEPEIQWSEAERLLLQGRQESSSSQFQASLRSLEAALNIYRDFGVHTSFPQESRHREVVVLNNIGRVYDFIDEFQQSLKYYNQALLIFREISDRAGEARILNNIGEVYRSTGQLQQALEYQNQALPISREARDQVGEAIVLNNIGGLYDFIGQPQQALAYYSQALPIFRETRDHTGEANTLNNIGGVYASTGQRKQALEFFNQALPIFQNARDRAKEAITFNNIGVVYNSTGQSQQALKYYSQALLIFHEVHNPAGSARTLINIGEVYRSIGQPQQALDYYNQALTILQEVRSRAGETIALNEEAAALNNIGAIYDFINQPQQSLESLHKALSILQKIGNRAGEAATLNNIGAIYGSTEQPQQALRYYDQALLIRRETEDRAGEANTLTNIGVVYRSIGQPQQALEYFNQALPIRQEVGDRPGEAITLGNVGSVYENQGNSNQAINYYQQSVNITESIQGDIQIEELKSSFASEQIDIYSRLISLLVEQGDFTAAFNYAERAKARAFLDQMASGQVDFRSGVDAQLLQQGQDLNNLIVATHHQLITVKNRPQDQQDESAIVEVSNRLDTLQEDYATLLTQIKLQSPATASLVTVDVAPLAEIQSLLEPDTTLVEYFVSDTRTFAFILTRTSFDTVTLNVSREDVVDSVKLLRDFADLSEEHPSELQHLHQKLIKPLQTYLKTPHLIIVPHDILHYLPFAALTDGSHYLSEKHTLSLLPSANTLRFLPQAHHSETNAPLVFGDPITPESLGVLSSAQTEVKAIARLFHITPFMGKDATETRLRSQARDTDILHLAVHGEYNPINPLFSTLYLTADNQNDGRLEVHEIYGLDLTHQTNLVVLSACQTNIGQQSRGDEIVGLNRAFLYAGTPAVMSSLWNVDDAATALLMERFYTHLQNSSDASEALQEAQKEVRQQPEYAHPYYWSAFSITGH